MVTKKKTVMRRRSTMPQELEDPEDVLVNQESFVEDDDDGGGGDELLDDHDHTDNKLLPVGIIKEPSDPLKTVRQQLHAQILALPKEVRNLLSGGIAGMMAKTIVAPLDRIKILYQVSDIPFRLRRIPAVIRNIVHNEGLGALWKGNIATMIRVFPYSGIQFMIYDRIKSLFLMQHRERHRANDDDNNNNHDSNNRGHQCDNNQHRNQQHSSSNRKLGLSSIESLVAGMTAGTISVICTYPLDLTRAQLAVLRRHRYVDIEREGPSKSFTTVLLDNYKLRGIRHGLFRGITPTLLGIIPYSGIAFTLNEQGKREIHHVTGRDLTTIERMVCGAFAGLVAQTVTYPIEMTRRRMQTVGVLAANDTAFANLMEKATTKVPPPSVATATAAIPPTISSSPQAAAVSLPPPPPTLSATVRTLYAESGIRGFYKGVTMNWMKGPIAFSISFTTYDTVQSFFMSEQERMARLPLRKRLTMTQAPLPQPAQTQSQSNSSPK